jgi:hypothetical protein
MPSEKYFSYTHDQEKLTSSKSGFKRWHFDYPMADILIATISNIKGVTVKVLFFVGINFRGLVKNYKFVDFVFVPKKIC